MNNTYIGHLTKVGALRSIQIASIMILIIVLFRVNIVNAATFIVPDGYATILAAIDVALPGDTIQVGTVVEVQLSASSDDAEESGTGSVSLTSSDLELVHTNGSNQTVGVRFTSIQIPQGAQIGNAYIQFQVDENSSEAVSLQIQGEAVDNAPTFTTSSSRRSNTRT